MAGSLMVNVWLFVNVASSVTLVFVNKLLFVSVGFTFSMALTCFHFCLTSIYVHLQASPLVGAFKSKRIPWRDVLLLSGSFCTSVVFLNLSLETNSVGFYQLSKILQTPAVALIETVVYGQRRTGAEVFALALVCGGVMLATVENVSTNVVGTFNAAMAVLGTVGYHVLTKAKSKELSASSYQLLYYLAPASAASIAAFVPVMEPGFFSYSFTGRALAFVCLSGTVAILVNLSGSIVISKTSALTFSVCSHLKTCLVLLIGFLAFDHVWTPRTLLGAAATLVGIILYSVVEPPKSPAPAPTPAPKKEQ
eukprot:tig00020660_g12554.t1